MSYRKLAFSLVLIVILTIECGQAKNVAVGNGSFPANFTWGAASAAYQVEGAWNVSGKGPSIWDTFAHIKGVINNDENGDIADDFYTKYPLDIALMKELGMKHFRFSLSWSRLLPDGTPASNNSAGIQFYQNLISTLKANDIEPWVTLYHWDLPQALDKINNFDGWLNKTIVDVFKDYADFCFKTFGDDVKHWLTINEISSFAWIGYGNGKHAPGRCSADIVPECNPVGGGGNSSTEPYIVAHHAILAHAQAVQLYNTVYKNKQNGAIGFTFNAGWALPFNPNNPDDYEAVQSNLIFNYAWFVDPIVKGDYPDLMKSYVGSRLLNFTDDEKNLLKNSTVDFLGLNHYTSRFVQSTGVQGNSFLTDGRYNELTVDAFGNSIGEQSSSEWLYVYPTGFRELLRWVEERYDGVFPIYVFENGVSCPGEANGTYPEVLNDTFRVNYLQNYIANMVYAIMEDGINIKGYFAWSLTDNFEWAYGYNNRFGLIYVDYTDPNRTRSKKASADWYSNAITNITGGQNLTTVLSYLGIVENTIDTVDTVDTVSI